MRLTKVRRMTVASSIVVVFVLVASLYDRAQRSVAKPDTSAAQPLAVPRILEADRNTRPLNGEVGATTRTARVDPHVRPASVTIPSAVTAVAIGASDGRGDPFVSEIKQGDYVWERDGWWSDTLKAIPLRLAKENIVLTVSGDVSNDKKFILLRDDGTDLDRDPAQVKRDGVTNVTLAASKLTSTDQVVVVALTEPSKTKPENPAGGEGDVAPTPPPSKEVDRIKLRLPGDLPERRPVITEFSNGTWCDFEAVDVKNEKHNVRLYDHFLRVKGQLVRPGTELQFHIFEPKGGAFRFRENAFVVGDVQVEDNGVWQAELRLQQPMSSISYRLVVLASLKNGDVHNPAEKDLQLTGADSGLLTEEKSVTIDKVETEAVNKPVMQLATKEPTVALKLNAKYKALAPDVRVLVRIQGADQPIGIAKPPTKSGGEDEWSTKIKLDADGLYRLEAAVALGASYSVPSPVVVVSVSTGRPRVVSVEPTNLSFSPELRTIKVNFDPSVKLNDQFQIVEGKGQSGAEKPQTTLFDMIGSNKRSILAQGTPLKSVQYNKAENSVTLIFEEAIPADIYTFIAKKEIQSHANVPMESDYSVQLIMPVGAETPTVSRGITGPTGPNVEFPEYTNPRKIIDGFNPSDRVETRVSRLYYYRDAHRVAQIINRDVKSYNRAAVDMQQQLADKSRQIADQATDDRRSKERRAVEAAKKTREAERELQEAEALATNAANQAANAAADQQRIDQRLTSLTSDHPDRANAQAESDNMRNVRTQLERVAESARRTAESAYNKVQMLREQETAANEEWQMSIATEDRAREEQFRREVAAARADPDTYAPGKLDSEDPVRQVSVSVIGEGLIQLRGPIKGINVIRTMINQIDAPVGQVRVAVHTVQINGEKGDRMERVAGRIQRFIDHSRFLTLQSAEMLRKAIVTVAAQRAMELGELPGMTQEERDRKYLYSFFGDDFIRELEVMDSEFLQTGNKLLSLHSMDSTSLASAMFIMALAKNTTRMEILQAFDGMMAGELPMAEQNYFEAGLTCDGKHRLFDGFCKRDDFQLLSGNARFQSIRGLFDAEIAADDTMTPIQREFVRLAQIFKSRLIVEMELKQRVMERAVIEERLGNREKELLEARNKEKKANDALASARQARRDAQKIVLVTTQQVQMEAEAARQAAMRARASASDVTKFIKDLRLAHSIANSSSLSFFKGLLIKHLSKDRANPDVAFSKLVDEFETQFWEAQSTQPGADTPPFAQRVRELVVGLAWNMELRGGRFEPKERATWLADNKDLTEVDYELSAMLHGKSFTFKLDKDQVVILNDREMVLKALRGYLEDWITKAEQVQRDLSRFELPPSQKSRLEQASQFLARIIARHECEVFDNVLRAYAMFELYGQVAGYVVDKTAGIPTDLESIQAELLRPDSDVKVVAERWGGVKSQMSEVLREDSQLTEMDSAFRSLLEQELAYRFASQAAEEARRPLDHKKFLDMLVDEMEDKYIELLEGTRAHTANIDAYIKRLMTCLDDDFNTQFYYPTFRKVREASQFWDVQMGQVETTNVLANNRAFAKVSPEATMEFDLPKRDIMIAEAIDGAKAMIDDVGALAQDPTFLAMAKLNGGQPTSSPVAGATGGFSTVRNVLPGLSTDTAEAVLGQQGPGGSQFGAALEGLIPDPAIYKFETGTGWEIRPVIQPDGQAVVFHFNYMYTTNIREPVRADEKHLGRVKRHFVDTDVQLSNYELREVSRYTVALKAARTSRGVPLLEDIPVAGVLFRPLPSAESSLQQNVILSQATIFPTLFDLMGLRWAPVVSDLDPLRLSNDEFVVRNRRRALMNRVFDHSSSQVDEFLRIPEAERRMDLYRSQETIPSVHPNGYSGPGANLQDSQLQEGYSPTDRPQSHPVPGQSTEGSPLRLQRPLSQPQALPLNAPQGGAASGLERVEPSAPPTIAPPIKAVPVPAAVGGGHAFSPQRATAGEVAPASYLQPVSGAPSLRPVPSPQTQIPLPPRQAELRRLPQVDGNVPSN